METDDKDKKKDKMPNSGDEAAAAVLTKEELDNVRKVLAENEELKRKVTTAESEIAAMRGAAMPQVFIDQHSQAKTPAMKEGMSYAKYKFDIECWEKATPKMAKKDRGPKLIACWPEDDGHGGLKKTLVNRLGWEKIEHTDGVTTILKELENIMCCPSWVRAANWQDNWDSLEQGADPYEAFLNKIREAKKMAADDFGFEVPQVMICSKILRGCKDVTPENVGVITQSVEFKSDDMELSDKLENQVRKFISSKAVMGNSAHKHVHVTAPSTDMEEMQIEDADVKKAKEVLAAHYKKKNAVRKGKETQEERSSRCFEQNLCFTCERPGHQARDCPEKRARGNKGRGGYSRDDRRRDDYRDRSPERRKGGRKDGVDRRRGKEDRWNDRRSSSSSEDRSHRKVHLLSSIKDFQEEELITKPCKEDVISDSSSDSSSSSSSSESSLDSKDGDLPTPERRIQTYLTGGGKSKDDLIKCSVLKVANHDVGSAAILDSGCAGSLMGYDFLEDFTKRLSNKDKKSLAKMKSKSTFSFGDGRTVKSVAKIKCPIYMGSNRFIIEVDLVDVKIPMLISLQAMQSMEMQLHLSDKRENRAYVNGQFIKLIDRSGHIWASVTKETSKEHVTDQVEMDQILLASKSIFQDGNVKGQLKKLHDNLGHMARDRLEEVVKEGGFWNDEVKKEMDDLYKTCPSKKCRTRRQLGKGPVASFKMARQFAEVVGTDLKIRHGKDDIMYMIDHCTSFATASLIKSKQGEEIAEKMFEAWYAKGLPRIRVLISDNGTEYLNPAVGSFVESHNTVHMCSVPYHPEGNGVTERVHAIVDMNMSSIQEANPEISDKMALDLALLAYNQSEMRSGFSPSQLVFGQAGAMASITDMSPQEQDGSHLHHRFGKLFKAREDAIAGHIRVKTSNKIKEVLRRKSRPTTEKKKVGEWVWLYKKDKWHGPGRVCAALDTEIAVKIGGRWHGAKHSDLLPLTRKEILDRNLHRISEVDFEATKTYKSISQDNDDSNEESVFSYLFYPFGVEAIHATDAQQVLEGGQDAQLGQARVAQDGIRGHDRAQDHEEHQVRGGDLQLAGDRGRDQAQEGNLHLAGNRGRDANQVQDRDRDQAHSQGQHPPQPVQEGRHISRLVTPQVRDTSGNTSTAKASTVQRNPDFNIIKSNDKIEIFDNRDKVWELATVKSRYRSRKDQFNVKFDIDPEARRVFCPKNSEWRFYNETPKSREILVTDKNKHSVLVTQVPRYRHKDKDVLKAKEKELDKLKQFDTYKEVKESKLSSGQRANLIASTWSVVNKGTSSDPVIKARLCARGDLEKVEVRTDSPTTSKASIRLILSIAASNKWVLHSLDFTNAFLQGASLEREVFLRPPPDVRERNPGVVWQLIKRIYGLKDASRGWYLELSQYLQELGGQLVDLDQAMYCFKDKKGQLIGVVGGHVDDLVYGGTKEFHRCVIKRIIDKYVIGKVDVSKFTFVGWELSQTEGEILLSQKQYLEDIDMDEFQELKFAKGNKQEIVNDELQHLFRSANGLLGWIVQVSRPDLNFLFIEKSTKLGNATVEDCRSVYRVLHKARQEVREIKFSNLGPVAGWGLKLFTDASYRKLNTVDSVGGDLVFITGNNKVNILQWNSGKVKVPVTSPLTAESWAAKKAYNKSCFYKKMIKQITGHKPKVSLVTDSKSLYQAAYSDNAISDERNAIYVSVIRSAIKWNKLSLSWTEREFQPADVLTKAGANPYLLMKILAKGRLPRELRHDPRPEF